MQVDSGAIVAGCALISLLSAAMTWVGAHFVQDVQSGAKIRGRSREEAEDTNEMRPRQNWLTAADLEAAFARHEVDMLERFNGRYPSKEVFLQGLEGLKDQIVEVRKYIGDARRDLIARIDHQASSVDGRLGGIEKHIRRSE